MAPRARLEGDPGPRAAGGDRRSGRIETHRGLVLDLVAQTPDITIEELRRLLAGRGLGFGYGTVQRFLVRHGMTRKKKTGHASEQDRPDILAWRDGQAVLDHGPPGVHRRDLGQDRPVPTAARRAANACAWPGRTATGRPRPSSPGSPCAA